MTTTLARHHGATRLRALTATQRAPDLHPAHSGITVAPTFHRHTPEPRTSPGHA